jgi:hypothetical protein
MKYMYMLLLFIVKVLDNIIDIISDKLDVIWWSMSDLDRDSLEHKLSLMNRI